MAAKRSNLQCFLDNVTPKLETNSFFRRPPTKNEPPWNWCWGNHDHVEYYTLYNLWEFLAQWSAYGISTDLVVPGGETIAQHFTPYLSAIQLYRNDKTLIAARKFALQNGMDWYGCNYDPESSQSMNLLFSKMNIGDAEYNPGSKYFEYFETSAPYTRMPLADKVQELAWNYPDLRIMNSLSLTPSSWMSIAWFPIYAIPAQLERDEHKASFLTYHHLSTCPVDIFGTSEVMTDLSERKGKGVSDKSMGKESLDRSKDKQKDPVMMKSLPPFGLVSNKVNRALWNNPETGDKALSESLLCAAGTWLRQVGVEHHDFNFFISH